MKEKTQMAPFKMHMLITGDTGGIGRATSAYFSPKGWKVNSCDVASQDSVDETSSRCTWTYAKLNHLSI